MCKLKIYTTNRSDLHTMTLVLLSELAKKFENMEAHKKDGNTPKGLFGLAPSARAKALPAISGKTAMMAPQANGVSKKIYEPVLSKWKKPKSSIYEGVCVRKCPNGTKSILAQCNMNGVTWSKTFKTEYEAGAAYQEYVANMKDFVKSQGGIIHKRVKVAERAMLHNDEPVSEETDFDEDVYVAYPATNRQNIPNASNAAEDVEAEEMDDDDDEEDMRAMTRSLVYSTLLSFITEIDTTIYDKAKVNLMTKRLFARNGSNPTEGMEDAYNLITRQESRMHMDQMFNLLVTNIMA